MAQQDFAAFFAGSWRDLAGYARTLAGDDAAGDDLAQEALVRVYARYALLRDPRGYAFRIVTNLSRDRWRHLARERSTWESLPRAAATPDPDNGILDAVLRLHTRHREVLLLHYWADMSVEEVARALHRPAGTVKRWLSEARTRLAEAMSGPS